MAEVEAQVDPLWAAASLMRRHRFAEAVARCDEALERNQLDQVRAPPSPFPLPLPPPSPPPPRSDLPQKGAEWRPLGCLPGGPGVIRALAAG